MRVGLIGYLQEHSLTIWRLLLPQVLFRLVPRCSHVRVQFYCFVGRNSLLFPCVRVCVCVRVCACARARACVCVCVSVFYMCVCSIRSVGIVRFRTKGHGVCFFLCCITCIISHLIVFTKCSTFPGLLICS
jgi:hypothetical protein